MEQRLPWRHTHRPALRSPWVQPIGAKAGLMRSNRAPVKKGWAGAMHRKNRRCRLGQAWARLAPRRSHTGIHRHCTARHEAAGEAVTRNFAASTTRKPPKPEKARQAPSCPRGSEDRQGDRQATHQTESRPTQKKLQTQQTRQRYNVIVAPSDRSDPTLSHHRQPISYTGAGGFRRQGRQASRQQSRPPHRCPICS